MNIMRIIMDDMRDKVVITIFLVIVSLINIIYLFINRYNYKKTAESLSERKRQFNNAKNRVLDHSKINNHGISIDKQIDNIRGIEFYYDCCLEDS